MKLRQLTITTLTIVVCSTAYAVECEVSSPIASNLPDWMGEVHEGFVWVGSPNLAAHVPEAGHWTAMGPQRNYFDKWWWWREGYRAIEEPEPDLVITATRLDESFSPVVISNATNAISPGGNGDLMLVGMEFPTSGCWEVVGRYQEQELRFVFKVGE